jgi:asparagine synthase (glutamine-hydrolysing)
MGGIAGIIRFDGKELNPDDLIKMESLLKHRGATDRLNMRNGCMLTFGGNIENESTFLVAAVDADIYGAEYSFEPFCTTLLRDGPNSVSKMNADFSTVIWDTKNKSIFCFRDIMGVKPLYYIHKPGRFFAFASEIKALNVLSEVTVLPNKNKFKEYLTWPSGYMPYSNQTFYESVYSILPGHYLQVDTEKVAEIPYCAIDTEKYRNLKGIKEFSETFKDQFTSAINTRIKNKKSVASHLSGGLDSSSVSCTAQSLLNQQQRPSLITYHIDTGQPFADEQMYVQAVTDKWKTNHYQVRPVTDVVKAIQEINFIFDRPEHFIIPSSFHLSVSHAAKEMGCDLILTGHDGDSIVSNGLEYLDRLLTNQQWQEFQVAAKNYAAMPDRNLDFLSRKWMQLSDQAKFEKFVTYALGPEIKNQLRKRSMRSMISDVLQKKKQFDITYSSLLSYFFIRLQNKLLNGQLVDSVLTEDFKRTDFSSSHFKLNAPENDQTPYDQRNYLHHTTNIICNEQLNHIGAYYGHQYAFPFFDKNVMEIGLSTPDELQFDHGLGRGLIRHGLQHVLPASILSRVTKANFVEYGTLTIKQLYSFAEESLNDRNNGLWEIIDRQVFLKLVKFVFSDKIPANQKTRYNFLLSRIIYLYMWLDSCKLIKK